MQQTESRDERAGLCPAKSEGPFKSGDPRELWLSFWGFREANLEISKIRGRESKIGLGADFWSVAPGPFELKSTARSLDFFPVSSFRLLKKSEFKKPYERTQYVIENKCAAISAPSMLMKTMVILLFTQYVYEIIKLTHSVEAEIGGVMVRN